MREKSAISIANSQTWTSASAESYLFVSQFLGSHRRITQCPRSSAILSWLSAVSFVMPL